MSVFNSLVTLRSTQTLGKNDYQGRCVGLKTLLPSNYDCVEISESLKLLPPQGSVHTGIRLALDSRVNNVINAIYIYTFCIK